MNKKLLFAAISLAALTACTSDDFESKKVTAEEVSPVQFEVINLNNEGTRASMDGNTIKWSATDGDLFTLYHGATSGALTGFQNATYKATTGGEGTAILTTPSIILQGEAIMVWPVDSDFQIKSTDNLSIKIPAVQKNIEKNIPYVSDRINIGAYAKYDAAPANAFNTAGKDRKYPVYMRPMASQLNLTADYAGTDATLATLYTGDDPIDPIEVTSIDLLTNVNFTTKIAVKWSPANANWPAPSATLNHAWNGVTDFGAVIASSAQLTAEEDCLLEDNTGCKFLLLPQPTIAAGSNNLAAVVVNTIYGKVVVAPNGIQGSEYKTGEDADAWYRYLPSTVAEETYEARDVTKKNSQGWEKVSSTIADGMMQTINGFSAQKAPTGSTVEGEPIGAATTRFVKVLLSHLDMSDLHVKSDDQLRYAAKVWQKMNLSSVTVYLDGDATSKAFVMSQKTIETINAINAAAGGKHFFVTPCSTHPCNEIIIKDGGKIQDLTFITDEDKTADVVLQSGFTWKWDGSIQVHTTGTVSTGIATIINRGTLENAEDKILNIVENNAPTYTPINIKVKNDVPGKWNITAGRIRVQNQIENFGTVTISSGAQFIEDGAKHGAAAEFINNALTKEKRFNSDGVERIGKVINSGVFATIGGGVINNYSLIEHADEDAKTYITHNQLGGAFGTNFTANTNMMGRINLPFGNKDEDNISISAVSTPATMEGFVSVTITAGNAPSTSLSFSAVGEFVNSLIVNGGINEIADLPSQIKYVEVATDKEIAWNLTSPGKTANYNGLTILSDVNIKLGTTVNAAVTYLGAEMYVGGTFNKAGTDWDGYYGDTSTRVAEHYITFK